VRTFLSVTPLLCAALCGCCSGPDPAAQAELDGLQGEWELVRLEIDGYVMPLERIRHTEYVLRGNRLTPVSNPDEPGTLDLRPGKQPAWIDRTGADEERAEGIYRLDGDRWEICFADTSDARPTEFKTVAGNKAALLLFQRKAK
jgi:uncharacterized protein (TIGR03067 family)